MQTVLTIIAAILALAATILAFIFIIPEKKRARLNGFGKFLHDLLNFKFLIIEKIIQFCYVLATAFTLLFGFVSLFFFDKHYHYNYYSGTSYSETEWVGYYGFLIIILGPIAVRLAYELLMMAILAVKNIIQINNKLKNQNEDAPKSADPFRAPAPAPSFKPAQAPAPTAPVAPAPAPAPAPAKFCVKCGSALYANGACPNPNCR